LGEEHRGVSPLTTLPDPAPGRNQMLDKLGLSFAVVFLLLGSILLYDAVSKSDLTQTARVIGGAVFLALAW